MSKRIVTCADGTWNKLEQTEQGKPSATNVAKLAAAVAPEDNAGRTQIVYYHPGVGERGGLWDHVTGGAFGVGISANIEDIYLFLATNYQAGDELFLFGFSRGAYTVRSLAGLIRNAGILKREFMGKYRDAYELYRDRDNSTKPGSDRAIAFRKQFSWPDFNIRFIGVWDTVGALGIPVTPLRFWSKQYYEFHDVTLSTRVDFAYQALATDERRKPFLPTLWQQHVGTPPSQVLEQAWFPGVHSNVGGGYPESGLSDGALRWMWDRAAKAGLTLSASLPEGNPKDTLRDSMTLFYRVLGDGTRAPGSSNGTSGEKVHKSAVERMAQVPAYHPANLKRFLGTVPPPPIAGP